MAWIESHTALQSHPKLIQFRGKMRWSKNEAIGFLHRFWWTVLDYAPDGVVSTLSPSVMSEVLEMSEDQFVSALAAMEEFGFVDRNSAGLLVVHDWWDFAHRYLSETKFKGKPERLEQIKSLYQVPQILGKSKDSPRKTLGKSKVPTNQPTNQPTHPARGGGTNGEPKPLNKNQQLVEHYRSEWRKVYGDENPALPKMSTKDFVHASEILKTFNDDLTKCNSIADLYLKDSDSRLSQEKHPFSWLQQRVNKYSSGSAAHNRPLTGPRVGAV